MNDEILKAMKAINRDNLHNIWLRAKEGTSLEGEKALLARMMQEHVEYIDVWERLNELGEDELELNGVNPLMHVSMHSVIENQLERNTPPEVRKALDALLKAACHATRQSMQSLMNSTWNSFLYSKIHAHSMTPPISAVWRKLYGGENNSAL